MVNNNMESLDQDHSKLLGTFESLLQKNSIAQTEYAYVVKLLELSNQKMLDLEKTCLNSDSLAVEIVKIIRSSHKPDAVVVSHSSQHDETSSPLGTFLHEKKKRQHAEHELKISLARTEIDRIIEIHEDH